MPEVASKIVWVTPTTHERLVAIKEANDLASFDRLILRALEAYEAKNVPREVPVPPENAS